MTNTTNTYNGWTNYATWRVQLEMLDGQTCEDFGMVPEEGETCVGVRQLAGVLQDSCAELIELDAAGLALGYALAFLDGVNWYELAEHMIEDAETSTTRTTTR
jgi:hypothetical protein